MSRLKKRGLIGAGTALAVVGVALPLMTTGASALTHDNGVVNLTTSNTANLNDGDTVTMNAAADTGHTLTNLTAHLCVHNPNPGGLPPGISVNAQFVPGGGFCTTTPLGSSSGETTLNIAPAVSAGTLTFNVGYGTAGPVTCTAASPCDLYLREDTDQGFQFEQIPLTFAQPPGPPAQVTPAPVATLPTPGVATAHLTWTAPPSNPGVSNYLVSANGGAAVNTASTNTFYDATGLTYFTAYTFTVAAQNTSGIGTASAASNSVTPKPAGPTGVTASSTGSGIAGVSWTAPAYVTGLTGYAVTPSGGPGTCVVTGTTASCTGLTDGLTYTFSVVANYSANTGLAGVSNAVSIGGKSVDQVIFASRPAGTLDIAEACANNYNGQSPVTHTGGTTGATPALPLNPTVNTTHPNNPGVAGRSTAGDRPGATFPTPATDPAFGMYPQTCDVDLGTGVLNATSTDYVTSGAINTVSVRDLRDTDTGWTVGTQITPFSNGTASFPASCLSFTPTFTEKSNNAGIYTQNATVPGFVASTTATTGTGTAIGGGCLPAGASLAGQTVLSASPTLAGTNPGNPFGGFGRTDLDASLTLNIPVSAPSGTYSSDLTFTVLGS
jgi:hypothetical protein